MLEAVAKRRLSGKTGARGLVLDSEAISYDV
jgi:hypothetical protein